jgi:DNA-binding XRE family transcriptional regulator
MGRSRVRLDSGESAGEANAGCGNAGRRKGLRCAKARLENGDDELIPLEIIERRLSGEPALRIWREHRELTQERPAKKAKVSRALIAAIETKRKTGSVGTWKRLMLVGNN